jgi:arylsulfatase A-like enzyme
VPTKYFAPFSPATIQLPTYTANDLDDLSATGRRWALEAVTAGSHSTVVKHDQWQAAVAAYLACTHFVDHQIGRLIQALDAGEYGDNTIIVLWTDHGWHLGEKEHWGKWTGWERSTRVPLIIVPPKNQPELFEKIGTRCDQPVSLVDVYPTLAELCEVATPANLDGVSLVPLCQDSQQDTQRVVVTTFDPGNVTLRNDRWRYIHYADGSQELYDHQTDPHEWRNLANMPEHSAVLEEFQRLIPADALDATRD